jgi:hypothetical protein
MIDLASRLCELPAAKIPRLGAVVSFNRTFPAVSAVQCRGTASLPHDARTDTRGEM